MIIRKDRPPVSAGNEPGVPGEPRKKEMKPIAALSNPRMGMNLSDLRQGFLDSLVFNRCRFPFRATRYDIYMGMAYAIRDRLVHRWLSTSETYLKSDARLLGYLSAEYLPGPHLGNNLINLGIFELVRAATAKAGFDIHDVMDEEVEPGLGNGGLGRLAACFMDSLATLEIPAIGYGLRYEFGLFRQDIKDGRQVEMTDKWLHNDNPWEIARPNLTYRVGFGGTTERYKDSDGTVRSRWMPDREVRGMAYDTPILGYRVNTANLLRLWKAEAEESFDFNAYNVGDYYGAVRQKIASENITKVLYPNDEQIQGKELRLEQQYFLVSCSLQDMIRIHVRYRKFDLESFHEKFAVQLNDTHPSLAVPELMRLLVDEHDMEWHRAWEITRNTFAYTNHTLLPEALEKWPIDLFSRLLPRHLEIINDINQNFLSEVILRYPTDTGRFSRMSIFEEGPVKQIRMAHLATIGSYAVNGVAALHTKLLKSDVLHDFYELWPEKFSNKTNGVTPRRWIALSNPALADLISRRIGGAWLKDLGQLKALEPHAEDPEFRRKWASAKRSNKESLAFMLEERHNMVIDPETLFDVQVKRIHEYKRQHLNVLHIITLYNRLIENPHAPIVPRTFIFGGKAAPGYAMAKLIIRLIAAVGEKINDDPDVKGRLTVMFFPNFSVKNGQWIYPAADLSEQISTAGMEASGTGNMKFSMNGALTIGTLDGANVEIREAVGEENFFLFGMDAGEVKASRTRGYRPRDVYESIPELRVAIDAIRSGVFSRGDTGIFQPLVDNLLGQDPFMVLADYADYVECQDRIGRVYLDQDRWVRMSILNTARMGYFSSDRTIREYCEEIWKVKPLPVTLEKLDG
ncbi:glycogen/starch/alpha-glucan phosphorylase [Desulfococcus sp.]|uniref:glycogen/starch/alpha-glucan phosphorylase n=1 Tax=Desulfococcus sp. TaxID=2025834 RepID=UPI0035946292